MVTYNIKRVLSVLERLRRDLSRFERGEIEEIDIVDYIEDLSEDLGQVIYHSIVYGDPYLLFEIVDYTSDVEDGEITSLIFNMITLQLNAIISVIDWHAHGELSKDYIFDDMRNDDFINFSADTTIRAIEENNIDIALDIATSYLIFGFYSAIIHDEDGVDKAIDYLVYTGLKLEEDDTIKVLFKTHIYLSYLLLNEVIRRDKVLYYKIEEFRVKRIKSTRVAKIFFKLINSDRAYDKLKIEVEVQKRLARLIRSAILTKSDWDVLREIRSFNWLYRRYSARYGSIIEDVLYTLEGTVHAFMKSNEDINVSEAVLERQEMVNEDREIVALISSALKMYRFGLKDAYRNIIKGMKELSKKKRKIRLSRIADILMRVETEGEK